jgi:hypothetical protein
MAGWKRHLIDFRDIPPMKQDSPARNAISECVRPDANLFLQQRLDVRLARQKPLHLLAGGLPIDPLGRQDGCAGADVEPRHGCAQNFDGAGARDGFHAGLARCFLPKTAGFAGFSPILKRDVEALDTQEAAWT